MADRAHDGGNVGTPCADGVGVVVAVGERRNDEYGAAGDCAGNGLWFGDLCRHRTLHVGYTDSVCGLTEENSTHKPTRIEWRL
ncbi:hypothetical protein D3C87_1787550 [compost metagenome]